MSDVVLDKVEKFFGAHHAVRGIDLTIAPGEFVTLLGPSGCGKTSCLRMVAGFVKPSAGRILMSGQDVTSRPPFRRNTGMVFQSYALFPHCSVAQNVAFGLEVRRVSRAERDQRVAEALRLVRLEAFADRYPAQLSGGQKQRVALARAVVIRPDVLLLDEPLAALDLKLREELQTEIKRVQSTLGITTLFVTHDQGEALSMSDRVAVMQEGRLIQLGTPESVYERPNSRAVAEFVGRTNLLPAVVRELRGDETILVESNGAPFTVDAVAGHGISIGAHGQLGIRPEHLRLDPNGPNAISATVRAVAYFGSVRQVEAEGPHGELLVAFLRPGVTPPRAGECVMLSWQPDCCFLLKD